MHTTLSLFPSSADTTPQRLAPGAWLLPGFALAVAPEVNTQLQCIENAAPFRHMHTPGGLRMSVAMTNCGSLGWVSDQRGYRYAATDPVSGKAWPCMPRLFEDLAESAAASAGFKGFTPDACLINRYAPGAKLSLHQDKDEHDLEAPVVSVSLGLPAVFLFGGQTRADKTLRVPLEHGDVVVWGGESRLRYHGILPLRDGQHELLGAQRVNLTLRRAT